jgi:phosphohistidine swiveling domain-containing protein
LHDDTATLRGSLNRLTNRIVNRDTGLWRTDLERVETLLLHYAMVSNSGLDIVSRIYWLLEDCKRYGTLPFAGLARAGFIAVQILRSLVEVGVLSEEDRTSFMAGLDSVSSRMVRDLGLLGRESFVRTYGHLRPGTYDILSPRYDEAPDRYFDWSGDRPEAARGTKRPFALSAAQTRAIERLLAEHRIEQDVPGLLAFLEAGIKGRESSKFAFSRNLSDALVLIGRLGEEHGCSRDDMSYVDIRAIYSLYASASDVRRVLAESIARGREAYALTQAIALPPLLARGDDVWCFEMPPTEPNFITQRRVSAPVAAPSPDADLTGTIALITSADPGYDWVLSRGIAGFVTAYGGVNSHMAIRASELDLPAVIGAGEILFARWSAAQLLEIDAANRQVRVIR